MRCLGALLAGSVAALGVSGCDTLKAVTENPACVSRVSLKGAYGGGIPTGTWTASAVCNAPPKATKPEDVPPAPKEDPTP